jgi:hypothetical protein
VGHSARGARDIGKPSKIWKVIRALWDGDWNIFSKSVGGYMRIKVLDEKIVKAIKKLEGIDIVLKTVKDAQEAMRLILRKTDISKTKEYEGLKDIVITQVVEHPTSAVEYTVYYEIEFITADERYKDMEIALIRELQALFAKL